ncbi:PPE domain-containing protein [Pseudonocardia alni]|uniref:PPE domain-containing protein n=1 Tax=Pseudonocardia alni TaxID=33907 RepID=UPI00280B53DA|nr:hypothetical protein [Pseudonocardia alni]
MTAPRWAGLSHAEIVAMVAAGPGPSASAGAERAWRDAAAALTDVHRELAGQVRDLPGGWSGGTADGVTAAFGSLDGWVVSAAVDAGRTADALAAQAGLAADLRARMPAAAAPTPPETAPTGPALLDDWAAADLAAGNSAGRAAELMVRYDDDTRVTGAPWTGWGASPVVTHEGTAPASPAVPAPSPGPGGDADPAPDPAGGAATGTTVFAGIGFGGITAAVLTGNGRAGVPGARPIDVGGPSSGPAPTTDAPRTGTPGAPGTDTGPGTGDLPAGPASPAGAGVPDGVGGAVPGGGGTAVTAAVLAGGALGGAGILIGATIRRERRARVGRGPAEDGTPPGHPPGDGPPSGAEHRPPSGDATTSGTRAPSGTPAADGVAPPTPGGPAPDGATGDTAPHGGPAPHTGPAAGATTSDRPSPDGTGGGAAPRVPDGPRSPVHHGVTTGDLAVPRPDGAAPHGAVTHARHAPPPTPAPGDPAVAPAGIPVGAVPAAPLPVAATVGSPADPRTPAWRLVADEHAAPDDPPEQPDARPDPGVLRPDARWRGRG